MDTIARFEKCGTLDTFNIITHQFTRYYGWFKLCEDGRNVSMRKFNGRKHYRFCHITDVIDFQERAGE